MTVPQKVGVVGGGRMGAGIAQVFAALGSTVVIAESADQKAALGRVETGLARAHERGKLTLSPAEVLSCVTTVASPADLPSDLDLVVEAVPEIPTLKVEVLSLIDKTVSTETIIASNTSSISIAELGVALKDPARFIGMHFFNPVPASTLVEIVRAPTTSADVVERCLLYTSPSPRDS